MAVGAKCGGPDAPCAPKLQAAPLFTTLMQRAMELIRGCGCLPDTGCPGCVQHTECGEYNAVISKVLHC